MFTLIMALKAAALFNLKLRKNHLLVEPFALGKYLTIDTVKAVDVSL